MTVPISSADELSAITGGPPEFNSPVMRFIDPFRPPNPSPTAPAQPLPPDLEDPCIRRIGAVTNDLRNIAQMVHGRIRSADFDTHNRHRFPSVEINPRGQSFGTAMSRLTRNGFVTASVLGIQSFDHLEGENFQKEFSDGLWYHVVVSFPTGTDSNTADPRRQTPLITAHCHATNPTGVAHILDSIP